MEDSWKLTEFVVIPHRDSKDVFILGGTDDIQVLLDDSQVNISTIAGSRHVGPIKPKVEEWSKQLALFSETLVMVFVVVVCFFFLVCNFFPKSYACYRMSGWSVKGTGSILRAFLVLQIFKDSFPMKPKCLYKWINPGRIL